MKQLHPSWIAVLCAAMVLGACTMENMETANSGSDPADTSNSTAQTTPAPVFNGLAGTIRTMVNTFYCAGFVIEGSTVYATIQGLPPWLGTDGYFWGSFCGVKMADMTTDSRTPLAGGPVFTESDGFLDFDQCVARYNASVGFADGVGTAAKFAEPWGIVLVGDYLYVADSANFCIRKVNKHTGEVVTLAGVPGTSGWTDGDAGQARFEYPVSLCSDGTNLFVGDDKMVRKVDIASGQVTTLAGSLEYDYVDGTGNEARFRYISALTTDGKSVFVADHLNHAIRKIDKETGRVSTLAGGYIEGLLNYSSIDGTGSAAQFTALADLEILGDQLFVADNIHIRQVDTVTGKVSTIAGNPVPVGYDDHGAWVLEEGKAMEVHISPSSLFTDGSRIYFLDNGQIRVLE